MSVLGQALIGLGVAFAVCVFVALILGRSSKRGERMARQAEADRQRRIGGRP